MIIAWLILGGVAVWALLRLGRQSEKPGKGHWRVSATIFAAVALGGAALAAVRGAWIVAAILAALGLWLVTASRLRPPQARWPGMSAAEARSILGVDENADAAEVRAAWRRLMQRAHPDAGGTQGLAERLNAARDRLLKG
ncbi:molecular chaperone DnaJ [Brevundimonas sp.]|uniref:J domain-containing protein n=1 Tax=Brevundimonas sp. TaxID=1871086 RepID=UPI0025ECBD04|nr:molecular chaperone DnaJ [Brevundimonas sp.]